MTSADHHKSGLNVVFVGCLQPTVTHEMLYRTFAGVHGFQECKVITDATGQCRGFGFVHFDNHSSASRCIDLMDGVEIAGRFCNVKWSTPKRDPGQRQDNNMASKPGFQPRRGPPGEYVQGPAPRHPQPPAPRGAYGPPHPGHIQQAPEVQFGVMVYGLPPGTDWRVVKDALRQVADVQYVRMNDNGAAFVRTHCPEDADQIIHDLDNIEFQGHRLRIRPAFPGPQHAPQPQAFVPPPAYGAPMPAWGPPNYYVDEPEYVENYPVAGAAYYGYEEEGDYYNRSIW